MKNLIGHSQYNPKDITKKHDKIIESQDGLGYFLMTLNPQNLTLEMAFHSGVRADNQSQVTIITKVLVRFEFRGEERNIGNV